MLYSFNMNSYDLLLASFEKFICRLKRLGIAWTNGQNPGQRDDCSPNGCVKTQANGMIAAQTDALVVMLIIKYEL
jgi:hypothetical protein